MNRHDPSERIWSALKRLAQDEPSSITEAQAIKRVKAVARKEGAHQLPERALKYFANEYRDMVRKRLS